MLDNLWHYSFGLGHMLRAFMYSPRFTKSTGYLNSIISAVTLSVLSFKKSSVVLNSSSSIFRTAQSACSTSKKKQVLPKVIPTLLCAFLVVVLFAVFVAKSFRASTLGEAQPLPRVIVKVLLVHYPVYPGTGEYTGNIASRNHGNSQKSNQNYFSHGLY